MSDRAEHSHSSPRKVPAVAIRNLDFSYNGIRPVLNNVHLTLSQGSFTAILGPNGSGKTTLLRLILGLLTPDKGVVEVFGEQAGHGSQPIGYVPQNTASRPDFPVTVMEVALMGLRPTLRGFMYSSKERELAAEALHKAGIEESLFNRRLDRLSGGQRQRVFIARALVGKPHLLVFDEPTSNIDPEGRFCFFELMDKLKHSLSIIVVSHDLSIVASRVTDIICVNNRIIHNNKGRLTQEMLSLLYGAHDHACPMSKYLHEVSAALHIPDAGLRDD